MGVFGEERFAAAWRYHTKTAGFHKCGDPAPGTGATDAFGLVDLEGQGGTGLRLELDRGDDPKFGQEGLVGGQEGEVRVGGVAGDDDGGLEDWPIFFS